jgi:hypothetical protein
MYINVWNYEHSYYNSSNVFAYDKTNPTEGLFTHNSGQLTIKSGCTLITWSYQLVNNSGFTNRGVYFEDNAFIKSLNTGYLDFRYEPTTTTISCGDSSGLLHYGTGTISSSGSPTSVNGMFNLWLYSISSIPSSGLAVRSFNVVDGSRLNSPYTIYVSKDWTGYTSQTMSNLTVQQYIAGGIITYTGSPVGAYVNSVANIAQTMYVCPAINITLSGANSHYYMGNDASDPPTYVQLPTNGTITLSGNTAIYELLRVRTYNLTLSGTNATYNCYECSHNRYAADPPTGGTVTHSGGTLVMKSGYTLGTWSFTSTIGVRGITFENNSWIYTENTGSLNVNYTNSSYTMTVVCPETNCGFQHGGTGAWQIGPQAPNSPSETFNFQWFNRSTIATTSYVKCFANLNPWGSYNGVGGSGLIGNTSSSPVVYVTGNLYLSGSQFAPGTISDDSRWANLNIGMWGNDPARVCTVYIGWGDYAEGLRTIGSLSLLNSFTGALKLGSYFKVYSVSHLGGTLNLNGTQLYVESSYTGTDNTTGVGKVITTTSTSYTIPGIYINATSGTPWNWTYTDQLYSDWRVWVYIRGGAVQHGSNARKSDGQPSFDLTERVSAYTLAPTTDFRVGSFKINNYTVPSTSVWTIGGPQFQVQTGGLSAPASFTVNIVDGGNSKTTTEMYCDNTSFIWPQVTISTNSKLISDWKFKNIYIDAGTTTSPGITASVTQTLGTSGGSGATLNITNSTWIFTGATAINYGFLSVGIFVISDDLTGIARFDGINGTNLGNQYAGFGTNFGGKIINNISYNSTTDIGSLFLEAGFSTNTAVPLAGQIDVGYNDASFQFRSDHPGGNGFPIKGSTFNLGKNPTKRLRSYGGNWGNKGLYNTEASSVVDLNYLDLENCYAKGGGGWYAGPNSVDRGGNTGSTGWYFYSPATFSLSRSASSVDEGGSVTITLSTNAPNGSSVPYTITGITSADISGASLTGSFTVSGGTASVVLNISNDYNTEDSEVLTFALNNGSASIAVAINDTSLTPTYSLSRSTTAVTEGDSFTISLSTTNLPNGALVPYTITGVDSSDINGASLTGNFTISGSSASLTIVSTWDYLSENQEVLTLTLNPTYGTGSAIAVAINNKLHPTYAFSASPNDLNEGGNFTVTLTTTDIPNNTVIPYTISGVSSADINGASLTGNFTIVNGSASVSFTTTADYLTEGDESFLLQLDGMQIAQQVWIRDFYKTRTYALSTSATTVTEGDVFVITLNTTNVANDTGVPYTISGVSSADINGASLAGAIFITNNVGTQSFTTTADLIAEGTETFTLTLGSPASGSINVSIRDPVAGSTGNFLSFFE